MLCIQHGAVWFACVGIPGNSRGSSMMSSCIVHFTCPYVSCLWPPYDASLSGFMPCPLWWLLYRRERLWIVEFLIKGTVTGGGADAFSWRIGLCGRCGGMGWLFVYLPRRLVSASLCFSGEGFLNWPSFSLQRNVNVSVFWALLCCPRDLEFQSKFKMNRSPWLLLPEINWEEFPFLVSSEFLG